MAKLPPTPVSTMSVVAVEEERTICVLSGERAGLVPVRMLVDPRTTNRVFTFGRTIGELGEDLHPGALQKSVEVNNLLRPVTRSTISADLGELFFEDGLKLDPAFDDRPRLARERQAGHREVPTPRVDLKSRFLVRPRDLGRLRPDLDARQRWRDLRVGVEALYNRLRPRGDLAGVRFHDVVEIDADIFFLLFYNAADACDVLVLVVRAKRSVVRAPRFGIGRGGCEDRSVLDGDERDLELVAGDPALAGLQLVGDVLGVVRETACRDRCVH